METVLLALIALLVGVCLFLLIRVLQSKSAPEKGADWIKLEQQLILFEKQMKDEFVRNREEAQGSFKRQREELKQAQTAFEERSESTARRLNELLKERFTTLNEKQSQLNSEAERRIKEVRDVVEKQLKELREDNSKQLAEVNKTVNEKLQKTLNERLSQSFETVGKQLKSVQEGLGEMKNLASDVGGLKKVLSNVKMRGGLGEVQLAIHAA